MATNEDTQVEKLMRVFRDTSSFELESTQSWGVRLEKLLRRYLQENPHCLNKSTDEGGKRDGNA